MKKIIFLTAITVFGLSACASSPTTNQTAAVNGKNASAANSASNSAKTAATNSSSSGNVISPAINPSDPTNANHITKLDKQYEEARKLAEESGIKQPKYYSGVGVITELRTDTGEIELDHEEIKDLMPKMKMMFHTKDKAILNGFKVGEKVTFTLEDDAGRETITNIYKFQDKKGM